MPVRVGELIPSYRTTCPKCDGALYPVVLDPESAPWLCVICRRSWWVAELLENVRPLFRRLEGDFGFNDGARTIARNVEKEREDARLRGSSCRPDMVALVPLEGLKRLSTRTLRADLRSALRAELKRREG